MYALNHLVDKFDQAVFDLATGYARRLWFYEPTN
jgi:hypothetical protein